MILVVALAAWPLWLQLSGNRHEVVPGVLYRSAEPDRAMLAGDVRNHAIRSVLNLRGAHPDEPWYREEVAASSELGLTHVDFGMSATRVPDAATMQQLIEVMRSMPQPVLIHCRSGADRTGLAATLYLAAILGVSPDRAGGQLSFAYGHVGLAWLSRAAAMDRAWQHWRDAPHPVPAAAPVGGQDAAPQLLALQTEDINPFRGLTHVQP